MNIWQVYWRNRHGGYYSGFGYVKANTADEAYDITKAKLQKGCEVTAVYKASENWITPQSITLNFVNTSEYTFG
jgi:hypothetical protein